MAGERLILIFCVERLATEAGLGGTTRCLFSVEALFAIGVGIFDFTPCWGALVDRIPFFEDAWGDVKLVPS